MRIETHHRLPVSLAADAWKLYLQVFEPLAPLAVNRHVMTEQEFFDCAEDRRIGKYLALNTDAEVIGVGVQTNRLHAWPLISPEYFEAHWPDLYREGKIWYVGFVGVRDGAPGVFPRLLDAMSAPARDVRGMTFMDFCSYNENALNLPAVSERILRRIHPSMSLTCVDRQGFWGADFTKDPG
jgi:hypothetical protein